MVQIAFGMTASENETKFRNLGEHAQDAIIMTGPQGEVTFWNRAAERIFGYTSAGNGGPECEYGASCRGRPRARPRRLSRIRHNRRRRNGGHDARTRGTAQERRRVPHRDIVIRRSRGRWLERHRDRARHHRTHICRGGDPEERGEIPGPGGVHDRLYLANRCNRSLYLCQPSDPVR